MEDMCIILLTTTLHTPHALAGGAEHFAIAMSSLSVSVSPCAPLVVDTG